MTVLQAVLIGLVYYLGSAPWALGYLTVSKPLVAATLVGCILGDPMQGAILGATIQLIYLGWMSVGGSQPSDPTLAGTLAAALAIASNLDTNVALTLSVPLGMLGLAVWVGRNTFNTFILHMAEKPARKGNIKALWRINVLVPQIVLLLITALPVSLAAYFGPEFVQGAIEFVGDKVLGILMIIGGVLPAVGIALNLKVIMKKSVAPYYFMGFFLVAYLKLSIMGVAAFSIVAATLYLVNASSKEEVA